MAEVSAIGANEARRELVGEVDAAVAEILRHKAARRRVPSGLIDEYQDLVSRLYRGDRQMTDMRSAGVIGHG